MDRDSVLAQIRERIVAFATSRLSGEVAQDLAQDVLLVLHEKYPDVTELVELVPLSFHILRFKIMDWRRKSARRGESRQVPADEAPLADPGDDPETAAGRRETLERLIDALDRVGDRCRKLFRLKLDGKTFAEIRVLMGQRSINTIYTWDHRCRKHLLEILGGSWEAD